MKGRILAVELSPKEAIAAVYMPHGKHEDCRQAWEVLKKLLQDWDADNRAVILLGDVNADASMAKEGLCKPSSWNGPDAALKALISELKFVLLTEEVGPTWFQEQQGVLLARAIDGIWANQLARSVWKGSPTPFASQAKCTRRDTTRQLGAPLSDHLAVGAVLNRKNEQIGQLPPVVRFCKRGGTKKIPEADAENIRRRTARHRTLHSQMVTKPRDDVEEREWAYARLVLSATGLAENKVLISKSGIRFCFGQSRRRLA
jgi:hypothetical protein